MEHKKYNLKILDNFKKELIKHLYKDLYNLNKELYTNESITYEFFLFNYYNLIEENINFDKPDYPYLVNKINKIVNQNIANNKQNKEMNIKIDELYQNSEWDLINKFQSALELEKNMEEKQKKIEKMKKYNLELKNQIEQNKILKQKKDLKNLQNLKIEKQDEYLLNEKEAKKELLEMKIKKCQNMPEIQEKKEEINEKEEISKEIKTIENNDEMISRLVDKIMSEKREQKIDSILNGIKGKYHLEQNNYIIPEIKYDSNKIEQIIHKEMLKYQDI